MIRSNYPLKNISTIGLGGICKEFICPTSMDDLLKIKFTKKNYLLGMDQIYVLSQIIMMEPS